MIVRAPKKSGAQKTSSQSTVSKRGKKQSKKAGGGCCGAKKAQHKSATKKRGHGNKNRPSSHRPRQPVPAQRPPVAQPKVNRSNEKSAKLPVQRGDVSEPQKKDMRKEAPFERESKVVKSRSEAKVRSPERPSEDHARSHTKTDQQAGSKPTESEPVKLEELSIKTYAQGDRLHRTFGYHTFQPLPPKPVEVEKPKEAVATKSKEAMVELDGSDQTFYVCIKVSKKRPNEHFEQLQN